jgi:hypothetical protein
MRDGEWLVEQFEQHRGRFRAAAFRILGSPRAPEPAGDGGIRSVVTNPVE